VLFVGARESWYPHFGDSAEFSTYDFLFRWPRKLRLVATGSKLDEREEGDFRVGHWKTEKPMSVAGFNLGDYASASVASGTNSIEIYANRQLRRNCRSAFRHQRQTLSRSLPGHSVVPRRAIQLGRRRPLRVRPMR